MKTLVSSLLALTFFITTLSKPCLAQQTSPVLSTSTSATHSLTVVIYNVNNRSGKLYIGVANNQASLTGESVQRTTVDVPASGEITVTFAGLTPGRYAVRLYQDLNNNGKMDFSGQMPAEPFGFSNASIMTGPPDFDQSSFDLNEDKSIRVGVIEM